MKEILREVDSVKGLLDDVRDKLEDLRSDCLEMDACDVALCIDDACDSVEKALSSLGDIWYEEET